jgi:hypothetical protein
VLFQYYGLIDAFQQLAAPVTETLLGLPAYASTGLLFGIFRKELAVETLAVLAGTASLGSVMMTVQLYTFAIVSVLFVPRLNNRSPLPATGGKNRDSDLGLYRFPGPSDRSNYKHSHEMINR